MQVKIDTKEKLTIIFIEEPCITDSMSDELKNIFDSVLRLPVKNLILNVEPVTALEQKAAELITKYQQEFYENNASFVICCMKTTVESVFEQLELLELLNSTPTESEAFDIVNMEEIERELMDEDKFSE